MSDHANNRCHHCGAVLPPCADRPATLPVYPTPPCGCGDRPTTLPVYPTTPVYPTPPCGCGGEPETLPIFPVEPEIPNPACNCNCGGVNTCGCHPRGCHVSREMEMSRYRLCCDKNGCCCYYPCKCRNPYWPEFTHPRWLCCVDLYDGNSESCYDCCND